MNHSDRHVKDAVSWELQCVSKLGQRNGGRGTDEDVVGGVGKSSRSTPGPKVVWPGLFHNTPLFLD